MKKIITSAGLVVLGATGLQAVNAPGLSRMETTKPWSISASLRGFYDDNYSAVPDSIARSSFGFELRPSAGLNLFPSEQTYIGLNYTYSMKYYEDRANNHYDHTHEFEAKANHAFSERYRVDFEDSFVYSQEPELIDPTTRTTFIRTEANGVRNRASINFKGEITERVGLGLGYDNLFYDYEQDGSGSRSAQLDRVEHYIHVDSRWLVRPGTVGLVGYQFSAVNHTSDDLLYDPAVTPIPPLTVNPPGSSRDNVSHYGYVGAEHEFNPKLNVKGKLGVQYTVYDDSLGGSTEFGPYADVSGSYAYAPGSSAQIGVTHQRNATDVTGSPASPTLDQETTTFYASVSHQVSPNIFANLLGSFQHSVFNGGGPGVDNSSEDYFNLGLNFEYRFNHNWSTELGYTYDVLNSDAAGRDFNRNRVFLGVRASY